VKVGAFREPLDWAALAHRAREQGVALRVLFPSHVPEVFEASTGAYGRFAEVERGIREAVRLRARVVLDHPVTRASLTGLADLPRYADEALGAIAGISFWSVEGPDAPTPDELAPWWQAAMHACRQRDVGVEARGGLVAPADLPRVFDDLALRADLRGCPADPAAVSAGDDWVVFLRAPAEPDPAAVAGAIESALGLASREAFVATLADIAPAAPSRVLWHHPAAPVALDALRCVAASLEPWASAPVHLVGEGWAGSAALRTVSEALPRARVIPPTSRVDPTPGQLAITADGAVVAEALGGRPAALADFGYDLNLLWRAAPLRRSLDEAARGHARALRTGRPPRGQARDAPVMITVRLPDPSPDGSLDAPSPALVEALVRPLARDDGGCVAAVFVNLLRALPAHARYLAAVRDRCEPLGAAVRACARDGAVSQGDARDDLFAPSLVWALSTCRGDPDAPLYAGFNLFPDRTRDALVARMADIATAPYGPPGRTLRERMAALVPAACAGLDDGAGYPVIADETGRKIKVGACSEWRGLTALPADGSLVVSTSPVATSALVATLAGRAHGGGVFAALAAARTPGASIEAVRLYGLAATIPSRPVGLRVGAANATPTLDPDRCDHHGQCAAACPTGALTLVAERPVIDPDRCSGCDACVEQCPRGALAPSAPRAREDDVGGSAAVAWEGAALARAGAPWLRALATDGPPGATLPPTWQRPRRFGKRLTILGVAAATHLHHGACLLRDGEVVGAVQEERFRRRKQYGWNLPGSDRATLMSDPRIPVELPFPWASIAWLLERAGITLDDVDVVAVNGIPARLRSTYSSTDPGRPPRPYRSGRMVFVPHHLAHAASAYAVSGLEGAPVFTVDGRGERETAAFFEPGPHGLTRTWDLLATEDASIGGVYESLTMLLGFGAGGAGSTMGLAPYGRPSMDFARVLSARDHRDVTVHFREAQRLGDPLRRARDGAVTQAHKDLAASLQQALERTVISILRGLLRGRSVDALCMAGGVALNCSMNARIRAELGLRELFVQPAAHDGGTALGAAMEAHRMIAGAYPMTAMTHAYLGPDYTDAQVERALRDFGVPYERSADPARDAAERIADGQVVCWHQGRLEYGPRALGARSILADPRSRTVRDRINLMKGRAWWRPLGPSVLAGAEPDWFEEASHSPFMLLSQRVLRARRDEVPAVVHVDGSTRPQSVTARDNPRLHRLLELFAAKTGVPMVINTSFNTAWEPVVCSPQDALASFLQLGADHLVMGDFIVERHALERRRAMAR
jgi:carbamoyltransferase